MAAALALPLTAAPVPVQAQEAVAEDPIIAATQTRLAYIRTGSADIDEMTEAGLRGLGIMLFERTAVENTVIVPESEGRPGGISFAPVTPVAVDIERHDLSFYPILFWTIDPGAPMPSDTAIRNLNNYMRNGGLLVIDTRDQTTTGRGAAWLRNVKERGLDIGALEEVNGCADREQECHVLGKSHYIMDSFPGRYADGAVWVQRDTRPGNDRVSPVVIGGNEWVAAWATDEEGRYLYAIMGDEEQREHAFRFGINLVMHALTGNYKADAVHTPAILDRMSPR